MRILHVINHRIQFNGMVHAAVDLACAQADLGHDVALCSGPGDFDQVLRARNVRIFDLPKQVSGRSAISSAMGIARAARAHEAEVLHVHMVVAALLTWPVARLLRTPMITCVQNSFSKNAGLMRVGDRVITGCKAVAEDMAKRGVPSRSLRPILNGTIGSARHSVHRQADSAQSDARHDIQRPAVITAAGLHHRKGIPDLIAGFKAAARKIPDLKLYIFGGGPSEQEFRGLAAQEPVADIFFCGQASDLRSYLDQADVFVLASIADPAPLVICEAREAGLAVIGTRVDGIPELLEYGEAGILVDPHSPEQIAQELVKLFSDKQALSTWKQNSQIRVDKLNVRRVAEQTVAVYSECLPAARRAVA